MGTLPLFNQELKANLANLPDNKNTKYLKQANELRALLYKKRYKLKSKMINDEQFLDSYDLGYYVEAASQELTIVVNLFELSKSIYDLTNSLLVNFENRYYKDLRPIISVYNYDLKKLTKQWNDQSLAADENEIKNFNTLIRTGFALISSLNELIKEKEAIK